MTERLVQTLLPVFLLGFVGWWVAGRRKLNLEDVNRMNVDVFNPVLLVLALASKSFDLSSAGPLLGASLAIVLGSGLVAWGITRALHIDPRTFVPSMMFNNCGNIGMPVAYLAFGEIGLSSMAVLMAAQSVLMFSVGTIILRGQADWKSMARNPNLLASILGLTLGALQLQFPAWLAPALKLLADASIPLMLISLGVRMRDMNFANWKLPLLGAIVCPLSGLLVAPLLPLMLPLTPVDFAVAVLYAGMPPAVTNYLLAERYQRAPEQVASIVLFGNFASIFYLPFLLAIALSLA